MFNRSIQQHWRWYLSKSSFRLHFGLSTCSSLRSFHIHLNRLSILKQSFLTDLSLDIDVNSLKNEVLQQHKLGNKDKVGIYRRVGEALETKCSEAIDAFSPEQTRILKIIQLEHGFLYAEGRDVTPPELMTNKNWIEALTHSSKDDRLHYYLYLQHKANLRAKQAIERAGKAEVDLESNNESFILPVDGTTSLGNQRLVSAMSHSIPLVFDMSFDADMTPKEFGHAAKQLWMAYLANRTHSNPFHFVFTNCKNSTILYRSLQLRHLLNCQHFLVSETDKSYLDLYDKSKLVYLSSHAKHVLRRFDPSCVYILGAYSDPQQHKRFGPAKAKEQGIDCVKLPIDEHIKWIQGPKDLMLSHVVSILLLVHQGRSWRDAFSDTLTHGKNFKHYGE